MHVQGSTYHVLTHKSFPSLESGNRPLSFFCGKKWAKCSYPSYNGGKESKK